MNDLLHGADVAYAVGQRTSGCPPDTVTQTAAGQITARLVEISR
jgi:hypothetical protein